MQAAIAAVHDEAPSAEDTDWPQILALYDVLDAIAPGPVVTLNRAVAVAMVDGPRAGLALLGTLDGDERMAHTHRVDAVRGAPARTGRRPGRPRSSRTARPRGMTANGPEQHYLALRAARARSRPTTKERAMNWTLEVIVVPVSDVDRAKTFYADGMGFAVDHDTATDERTALRAADAPGSGCSIVISDGLNDAVPGSMQGVQLVVARHRRGPRRTRRARRRRQRDRADRPCATAAG